jgi:RNA polymerase sigma factor (sigma-70 family)
MEFFLMKPTVYILDDEHEIVELISIFLADHQVEIKKFTKGEVFLEHFDGTNAGCLIMDIQMPGIDGTQVLEKIVGWLPVYPVLFVSAHANVPITVKLMQRGAFDLIQKPFTKEELVTRVERAIKWSQEIRQSHKESSVIWTGMQSLTQREKEILDLLLNGMSSKEIAEKLSISRYTVDHHRAHILDKLQCPSLSGLTSAVAKAKATFEGANPILKIG